MREWWRRLIDRLPGTRERRWVAAVRTEFAFLADLGLWETELKHYVVGPMITFEGPARGVRICWEYDGIGSLVGLAWRDPDRHTEVMVDRKIRRLLPDAGPPQGEVRTLEDGLAATRLLAAQLAQVLPRFFAGE